MNNYIQEIESLENPSFDQIREIACNEINSFTDLDRDKAWKKLDRGVALLDTHEQLCSYLYSYGKMHKAKLKDAYAQLPTELFTKGYEIVDWGCGQGIGTVILFDHLKELQIENKIRRITLIEPSQEALRRALLHTKIFLKDKATVNEICEFFEDIRSEQIQSKLGLPVIHIFSNILDIAKINLKHLANIIAGAVVSKNYMVCVGPLNPTNRRIDAFYNYFNVPKLYSVEDSYFNSKWTYKCELYKLEATQDGNLVPIEFYPIVQFQAAYELDYYKLDRHRAKHDFFEKYSVFDLAAPFDIGASVYDDVHPILAVLNNIITRGLPTKASIFLENTFYDKFGGVKKDSVLGEISYQAAGEIDFQHAIEIINKFANNPDASPGDSAIALQRTLTPIAVARFQKTILEALITGHLSIEENEWQILVIEHDVPFAALAIKDFSEHIYHLTSLSENFSDFKLPRIHLDVISSGIFFNSGLHLDVNVHNKPASFHFSKTYDLVVDMAVLQYMNIGKDSFSDFNCKNDCYFKLRSSRKVRSVRPVYTSDLILYKKLVEKTPQGEFIEIEENKKHLNYFLQLIFRKEEFRPGQLPILDRALQNNPVIGLLPTGGGKSLTYQIAAILQPGVTLIIDPLRSLMKDQYDGLIRNGVDFCTYLNSDLSSTERRKREQQMEQSQMLFVFVSPERLSILNFRERLKQMHEYNVYFSYGVIDEVHCVSEWGHDFRFSYLHLGRNLYNYVKAKTGEISLFGLTATASFDVLADVERELSGNGAFTLDSNTVVRYENTNRLELQYKIEPVEIQFEDDNFYDQQKRLDPYLPKPVNVSNRWSVYDSKKQFLSSYLKTIPNYINELQLDKNIQVIKNSFSERQASEDNLENDLSVPMPINFYSEKSNYDQAGIVFCPHVRNGGISVVENSALINKVYGNAGSFSGKDEDNRSMVDMDLFKDNKKAIMVATKAFGMGIDKPNVRFTINMNYSSSLESFVQEAGRAGRDRKMAISIILVSDYNLVRINKSFSNTTFPFDIIKNKWFRKGDIEKILSRYELSVSEEFIDITSPSKDMIKLHCSTDNKMFSFNNCNNQCSAFKNCQLKHVDKENKGWHLENELINKLKLQNLNINRRHYQYLSADYETVMYFFNENFKGDIVEKRFMHQLLSTSEVFVTSQFNEDKKQNGESKNGFLNSLINVESGTKLIVYVPYTDANSADVSKAIYRMCCIGLVEDFTQDYSKRQYRISASKKNEGGYFKELQEFLLRYYSMDRAQVELTRAESYQIAEVEGKPIINEIRRCLAYLTEFVYEKISEKRKRAIDDMRRFCLDGISGDKSWIQKNEDLKDYIYYYFNSKYAKSDYVAENDEDYSLSEDTDYGKYSSEEILFKYMRVVDDAIVGIGTPIDNIKHLQGAVRLINRSLTDSNPTLSLLNAFTLCYLGTKDNRNLEDELERSYSEGMLELADRMNYRQNFWEVFITFNEKVSSFIQPIVLEKLINGVRLAVHGKRLNEIVQKYTLTNE